MLVPASEIEQTKYGVRLRGGPVEIHPGELCISNFTDPITSYAILYGANSDYPTVTDNVRYGGASIKTTAPASGSRGFTRDYSVAKDWSNYTNFRISCFVENPGNIAFIKVMFYTGANFAELQVRNIRSGWNNFSANLSEVYVNAGVNWAAIDKVRFQITANSLGTATITWDSVLIYPSAQKTYAAITFDDGYASVFDVLVPLFAKYNVKGTAFVPGRFIGTAGKMTAQQIMSVRDYGWDIGAHGNAHTASYDAMTAQQIRDDIDGCDAAYIAAGLDLPEFCAAPVAYTQSDLDKERVIFSRYRAMRAGGGTANRTNSGLISYPARSAACIPAYSMTGGSASVITKLNLALPGKSPTIFYCHDVAPTAPSQGISTADMEAILVFCAENAIEVVTMTELFAACPGIGGGLW